MKILYLAYIRLPSERAHSIQIMKTCEALADSDAEVTLLIPNRRTSISTDPFEYYEVRPVFTVRRLSCPDWVRCGPVGFVLSSVLFAEVAKWQKEFWNADVVYSRDALVLAQYLLLGRNLVYEAHAAPTWLTSFVARRARAVVVITESLKRAFIARGVRAQRIVVAHDAVGPAPERVTRAELGLPEGVVVTYAGSTLPGKGSEVVKAAEKDLPGTLVMVQNKTNTVARQILAKSDVVLVPNSAKQDSSATYTSPMKLFEALASGAAVVSADVPAIREVVGEDAVWFFRPDDPTDLARVVGVALNDPAKDKKIVRAQEVVQRFSWSARAHTITEALTASLR
jgi:hypothetical protein